MQGLPTSFQIAVLEKTGEKLTLEEACFPDHLDVGQVLVKVTLSGLCASQIHEIDGRKGPDRYLPHGLGHEGLGTVVAAGAGVTKVSAGDEVIMHWRQGTGIATKGSTLETCSGRRVNVGPIATLAQYSIVSENRLTPLPKNLPSDVAPLLGCALLTAYGAVNRDASVRSGESALILGFGGIGISILKFLRAAGAHPISVVDVKEEKLELAKSMGATEVIMLRAGESLVDAYSRSGASRPDAVFECTGVKGLIEGSMDLVDPKGRIVLIGVPDSTTPARIPTLALHLGIKLLGSHGGGAEPDVDIPRIARMFDAGLVPLSDFPKERYALGEINEAVERLRLGIRGRILIEV